MFGLGIGEIVVILFIALIFIGPKKLPELARGLGKGMREFQNAARGLQEHVTNPAKEVKDQIASTDQPGAGQTSTDQASTDQTNTDQNHTHQSDLSQHSKDDQKKSFKA